MGFFIFKKRLATRKTHIWLWKEKNKPTTQWFLKCKQTNKNNKKNHATASTINFIICNSKQFPHWLAFQKCQIPQYTGNAWNSCKNIFYVSTEKLPVKLTYSLTWRTLHSAYKGHGRKDLNSRRSLTCCKGLQKCLHLVNNKELEPHKSKFESWLSEIKPCHWVTQKISHLPPGREDRRV